VASHGINEVRSSHRGNKSQINVGQAQLFSPVLPQEGPAHEEGGNISLQNTDPRLNAMMGERRIVRKGTAAASSSSREGWGKKIGLSEKSGPQKKRSGVKFHFVGRIKKSSQATSFFFIRITEAERREARASLKSFWEKATALLTFASVLILGA